MEKFSNAYFSTLPRFQTWPQVRDWTGGNVAGTAGDSHGFEFRRESFERSLSSNPTPVALSLHLPFCENHCSFCGLNVLITKDHSWEQKYIDLLLLEAEQLTPVFQNSKFQLTDLFVSGGTPNFFSPQNFEKLFRGLNDRLPFTLTLKSFLIEVDPRFLTVEHLQVYQDLGVTDLQLGVQDFTTNVQKIVQRVSDAESLTTKILSWREKFPFHWGLDLIAGLPGQTIETWTENLEWLKRMEPARAQLYPYYHPQWIKSHQVPFSTDHLPSIDAARSLFKDATFRLSEHFALDLGFGHFVKADHPLYQAFQKQIISRTSIGFSSNGVDTVLGLGISAISESPEFYFQNSKHIHIYERAVRGERFKLKSTEMPCHRFTSQEKEVRTVLGEFLSRRESSLSHLDLSENQSAAVEHWCQSGLARKIDGGRLQILDPVLIPWIYATLDNGVQMRNPGFPMSVLKN